MRGKEQKHPRIPMMQMKLEARRWAWKGATLNPSITFSAILDGRIYCSFIADKDRIPRSIR